MCLGRARLDDVWAAPQKRVLGCRHGTGFGADLSDSTRQGEERENARGFHKFREQILEAGNSALGSQREYRYSGWACLMLKTRRLDET